MTMTKTKTQLIFINCFMPGGVLSAYLQLMSLLQSSCKSFYVPLDVIRTSLVAQWQRICLQMQETWVQSLSREDPLEEGMTTHSSILVWRIPWTQEPERL